MARIVLFSFRSGGGGGRNFFSLLSPSYFPNQESKTISDMTTIVGGAYHSIAPYQTMYDWLMDLFIPVCASHF